MAGNEDDATIFNDQYRNFLEKRKANLRGQFVAIAEVRSEATKKLDELTEEMKDCDAQLAKCAEVAHKKSKGKELKPGSKGNEFKLGSNYEFPIKVDSDDDEDEEPVRMIRYVGVQGEPSKYRGEFSGGKSAFGVRVEGGKDDMDISEDEGIVKYVIDVTLGAFAEAGEEEPAVHAEGAGAAEQGLQQQQERQPEEEQEDDEQNAEEQDNSLEEDNEMSENDDEAYWFDSD